MAYIEHDVDLSGHPKMLRLVARLRPLLGCETVDAVTICEGILGRLWCWAFKYAPDGDLRRYGNDEIALAIGWRGEPSAVIEALSDATFLEDGVLHDWHDHGGKLLARKKANAERMRESRATHVQRTCNARATHVSSQRRGEERIKNTSSSDDEWRDRFDDIWRIWPKKTEKKRSLQRWSSLKVRDRDACLEGARGFARMFADSGQETRFCPSLAVWIAGERWQDELPVKTRSYRIFCPVCGEMIEEGEEEVRDGHVVHRVCPHKEE